MLLTFEYSFLDSPRCFLRAGFVPGVYWFIVTCLFGTVCTDASSLLYKMVCFIAFNWTTTQTLTFNIQLATIDSTTNYLLGGRRGILAVYSNSLRLSGKRRACIFLRASALLEDMHASLGQTYRLHHDNYMTQLPAPVLLIPPLQWKVRCRSIINVASIRKRPSSFLSPIASSSSTATYTVEDAYCYHWTLVSDSL